jgi:phosphoribosylformylglycinamidine synthase
VGDGHHHRLPLPGSRREGRIRSLHAQVGVLAAELGDVVAHEHARQQAGLAEDLEAVAAADDQLAALGFADVHNVHVGRLVELDVDDVSEVEAMCERLLANTLIEDFEVQPL